MTNDDPRDLPTGLPVRTGSETNGNAGMERDAIDRFAAGSLCGR